MAASGKKGRLATSQARGKEERSVQGAGLDPAWPEHGRALPRGVQPASWSGSSLSGLALRLPRQAFLPTCTSAISPLLCLTLRREQGPGSKHCDLSSALPTLHFCSFLPLPASLLLPFSLPFHHFNFPFFLGFNFEPHRLKAQVPLLPPCVSSMEGLSPWLSSQLRRPQEAQAELWAELNGH